MTTPDEHPSQPIAPYMALGLSTVAYGIADRKHIRHNLETIEDVIHAAVSMTNINMPVKVIALAEGALTGFTDEILICRIHWPQKNCLSTPGEETEFRPPGKAVQHLYYRAVQGALARDHGKPVFQYPAGHQPRRRGGA